MMAYGFIASVLPVWFLLEPRDYLSTYMKLGTIAAPDHWGVHRSPQHSVPHGHASSFTAAGRSSKASFFRSCS